MEGMRRKGSKEEKSHTIRQREGKFEKEPERKKKKKREGKVELEIREDKKKTFLALLSETHECLSPTRITSTPIRVY